MARLVTTEVSTEALSSGQIVAVRRAVACLRAELHAALASDAITDLVFIGNSSEVYEWVPSRIVDFDCFAFTGHYGPLAGDALLQVAERTRPGLAALDIDFELRLIKGAYKPDRSAGQHPIVSAHLGLFDDERYLAQPALQRWAWRKYRGVIDPDRVQRLAPPQPTMTDLIDGPRGARERLSQLGEGRTSMTEYLLPTLEERRIDFDESSAQFVEFCYSSAASCARHHARVLGHDQPDRLDNANFFAWYRDSVMDSAALKRLMELKQRSRNDGFAGLGAEPKELAGEFLQQLIEQTAH
jgi:hypothetical protein